MDPFVGEIRTVGFNFAPTGWALCNGQLMAISQNTALFSLLGTYYGGNGTTTFALPDLRGATALHQGQGPGLSFFSPGDEGGVETVSLLTSEMPAHTHQVAAVDGAGTSNSPAGAVFAQARYGRVADQQYAPAGSPALMSAAALAAAGGGLPHNNMPPYLTVNFIIALQGVFPQRH